MKKLILFLALTLAGQRVMAQDTLQLKEFEKQSFAVLKWSPLQLLNPDPTFQAGAEFRMSRSQSIQVEAGYGRFASWGDNDSQLGKETWRGRVEYRWYFRPYRKRRRPGQLSSYPLGTYFAAELFYKQINIFSERSIGHECLNGNFNCAYYEQALIPVSRFMQAGYFKIGWQLPFSNQPLSRFLMDFNIGIGLRHISLRRFDRPLTNGGFDEYVWFDRFSRVASPLVPDLTVGVKVGYLLVK